MMMVWTDAAEAGILERIEASITDTSKELRGKDDRTRPNAFGTTCSLGKGREPICRQ